MIQGLAVDSVPVFRPSVGWLIAHQAVPKLNAVVRAPGCPDCIRNHTTNTFGRDHPRDMASDSLVVCSLASWTCCGLGTRTHLCRSTLRDRCSAAIARESAAIARESSVIAWSRYLAYAVNPCNVSVS